MINSKLRSMWRKIIYLIEAAMELHRAYKGLTERRWFSFERLRKGELFKLNPWIEYLPKHTQLKYKDAIELYNILTVMPVKFTRHRVKRITKDIIDLGCRGHSMALIKLRLDLIEKEYSR